MRLFVRPARTRSSRLRNVSLLSALTPRQIRIIDNLLHWRNFIAGEVVFDAGDEGQAIYFVIEGKVDICHQGEAQTPIATLAPGSYFGEMALLDSAPRSAQARAATDCELGVLYRGDFLGLLDTHAGVASALSLQLARELGNRVRELLQKQGG
jgi:CRP/FNR family cyclic AMP-dependent transcriptional regulator